jgi:DNA repair protein RadC
MTYTLNDLPKGERPRERLLSHGVTALSSLELLQILLGRGNAGQSVAITAQNLLIRFGNIQALSDASPEELVTVQGIGIAKACQIQACFELAKRVTQSELALRDKENGAAVTDSGFFARRVQARIADFKKEHSVVVSLDARGKLIGMDIVSVGILNASLVHPREVFATAFRRGAAIIIFAHNHPSGDLEPSLEDREVTQRLVAAGDIFGVPVVDHLIVSKGGYISFREQGLLLLPPVF